MQKPGKLQKPIKTGPLRKDRPPCPGCGASPGFPHAPDCTWTVATDQLQKPKAALRDVTDAEHQKWLREQGR